MKNAIFYYYQLSSYDIHKIDKAYFFKSSSYDLALIPTMLDNKEIEDLNNLNIKLINLGIETNQIIYNKANLPITNIDGIKYVLIRYNKGKDQIITINDIMYFSNMTTRINLKEIHETVSKIIGVVENNNTKEKMLNNFFDYYLPVLIKIVNRYDEIENQKLVSTDGKNFMNKADKMISDTNKSFKTILSNLYEDDIIDADADMKVYNLMLKADGIVEENIVKGEEESEK